MDNLVSLSDLISATPTGVVLVNITTVPERFQEVFSDVGSNFFPEGIARIQYTVGTFLGSYETPWQPITVVSSFWPLFPGSSGGFSISYNVQFETGVIGSTSEFPARP